MQMLKKELVEENALLKAQIEKLTKPKTTGLYNKLFGLTAEDIEKEDEEEGEEGDGSFQLMHDLLDTYHGCKMIREDSENVSETEGAIIIEDDYDMPLPMSTLGDAIKEIISRKDIVWLANRLEDIIENEI